MDDRLPLPFPTPEAVATAAAHECLAELARTGRRPERAASSAQGSGWRVTVTVEPDLPAGLSACERDALALLRSSPARLTTAKLLEALAAAGKDHGESTVKHALSRLVRKGLVRSSRKTPQGYWAA